MNQSPRFNYIITIHNKESLIEQVITAVLACARDNSYIYPILDGCTDDTEKIIDSIIKRFNTIPIQKVYAQNVHELLSINTGLRAAKHEGRGYNIILQDDVVLGDFMFEKKVQDLYAWGGSKLGYVSFRMGINFVPDATTSQDPVPFIQETENAYGHGIPNATILLPGQFTYRDIPIKSPVCMPFELVREIGMMDERLAPYAHDDVDFAIRCINAGYKNGVFALRFQSDIEWGGTRQRTHPRMNKIIARNMGLIREWHGKEITKIGHEKKSLETFDIPNTATKEDRAAAQDTWDQNQKVLEGFQKQDVRILEKVADNVKKKLRDTKRIEGVSGMPPPKNLVIRAASTTSHIIKSKLDYKRYSQKQPTYDMDLSFSEAVKQFPDPNELYHYMHHYFHHLCPPEIRAHRDYFRKERRGFGEDAFQAMWWTILREFKPHYCLEIGVYRGQVTSLFALIAKLCDFPCEVHALSPFLPVGHWYYPTTVDYESDVKKNFSHFDLPNPVLIRAYSNKPKGIKHIESKEWNVIYIDGDHDFTVVLEDYKVCLKHLKPGGILVFDDSSLETPYKAPSFASAGQSGPTRVAKEYAMKEKELIFLGAVGHNTVFRKR